MLRFGETGRRSPWAALAVAIAAAGASGCATAPRATEPEAILALGPRAALAASWDSPDAWVKRRVRTALAARYPETAEGLFARAWLAHGDEEIALYRRSVALDPGLAEAWANLVVTLRSGGRREAAAGALADGLTALRARRSEDLGLVLGVALPGDAPVDARIAATREALDASPGRPGVVRDHCAALLADSRVEDCVGVLRTALEREPGSAQLAYELGRVLLDSRYDWGAAEVLYERAHTLSDGDPFYVGRLGDVLRARDDTAGAIRQYRAAFAGSGDPGWLRLVGRVQRDDLHDDGAARETYAKAARSDWKDAAAGALALLPLVKALEPDGAARAEALLREALVRSPDDPAVPRELAALLEAGGRAAEGRALLAAAAERFPWDVATVVASARAVAQADAPRAVATLEAWLVDHPDSGAAIDALAEIELRGAADREAIIALLSHGLAVDPERSGLYTRLRDACAGDAECFARVVMAVYQSEVSHPTLLIRGAEELKERAGRVDLAYQLLLWGEREASGAPPPELAKRRADLLLHNGTRPDWAAGLDLLRELTAARPDDLALALVLLDTCDDRGYGAEGRALGERLLVRFPDAPSLHLALTSFYLSRDVEQARRHAPRAPRWHRTERLGRAAFFAGDLPEALRHLAAWEQETGAESTFVPSLRRFLTRAPAPPEAARVILQIADGIGIVSPDRRLGVNRSDGGILWVRDLATGTIVNWLEADGDRVFSFGPDSRSVVVGDNSLWRVYDVVAGTLRGAVPKLGGVPRWSHDSARIAQILGGSVFVHDVASGRLVTLVELAATELGPLVAFDWSADERWVALAYRTPTGHTVLVADAATGAIRYDFPPDHPDLVAAGANGWAHAVRFSPDSRHLAFSVEGARNAFMLDLASGAVVAAGVGWTPRAIYFSPDGSRVAWSDTAGADTRAVVADSADLSVVSRFDVKSSADAMLSADNTLLYGDKLYRVSDGAVVQDYTSPSVDGRFPSLAPGRLAFVDWKSRRAFAWDLSGGGALWGAPLPADIGESGKTPLFAASTERFFYKPSGADRLLEVSRRTGQVVRELPFLADHELWALSVDLTGRRLVALYSEPLDPGELTAWVTQRSNLTMTFDLIDLTTGARTGTAATELADRREPGEPTLRLTLEGSGLDALVWSPDGARFAATLRWRFRQRRALHSERLVVRDSASGAVLHDIGLTDTLTAAAFRRDGRQLALGTDDGEVHLYDLSRQHEPRELGQWVTRREPIRTLTEHDGTWLVAQDRTIRVLDAKLQEVAVLPGHMAGVDRVLTAPGEDRLFAIAGAEVSTWCLSSREKLATHLAFSDGGWLTFTPEGYYHASLTGDHELYWARAGELLRFDVFERSLRNPEAVYAKLDAGSAGPGPARPTARDVLAIARPRARVVSPTEGATVATDRVTIGVEVDGAGAPVEQVLVRQDGMVVGGVKLTGEDATARGRRVVSVEVDLLAGDNRFEVVAQTASARSDVARLRVVRGAEGAASPAGPGRLRFVGVGIAKHQDPAFDLAFPDDDVRAVADKLAAATTSLYVESTDPTVLVDATARRDAILRAVQQGADACQADDTLIVFLAGHGVLWRNRLFFFAHDSNIEDLLTTGLWWKQLDLAIEGNLCRRTLVLLDTCHAGDYFADGGRSAMGAAAVDGYADELARGAGVRVLAASTGDQRSYEDATWGHGAFTKALLEALDGAADRDSDGVVSVLELEDYARRRVPELVLSLTHERQTQTPVGRSEGTFRDYPLVKVARAPGTSRP